MCNKLYIFIPLHLLTLELCNLCYGCIETYNLNHELPKQGKQYTIACVGWKCLNEYFINLWQ